MRLYSARSPSGPFRCAISKKIFFDNQLFLLQAVAGIGGPISVRETSSEPSEYIWCIDAMTISESKYASRR